MMSNVSRSEPWSWKRKTRVRTDGLRTPISATGHLGFLSDRRLFVFAVAAILSCCFPILAIPQAPSPLTPSPKPPAAPTRWNGLIGEYGPEDKPISIFEKEGYLTILSPPSPESRL